MKEKTKTNVWLSNCWVGIPTNLKMSNKLNELYVMDVWEEIQLKYMGGVGANLGFE